MCTARVTSIGVCNGTRRDRTNPHQVYKQSQGTTKTHNLQDKTNPHQLYTCTLVKLKDDHRTLVLSS